VKRPDLKGIKNFYIVGVDYKWGGKNSSPLRFKGGEEER